jgi:6-phosphogluconolactonase
MNTLSGHVIGVVLGIELGFVVPVLAGAEASPDANRGEGRSFRVYIGTYTGGSSRGIYVCDFDSGRGSLSEPRLAAESQNPSWLELHPEGRTLYAVNEVGGGEEQGVVSAFAIDPDSGGLRLLNQVSSGGAGPCHLSIDRAGRHVLVANYGGGSVAVLPIGAEGELRERVSFIQHTGSSVNPRRQSEPHAHGIYVDAGNRFAVVPDLGVDRYLVYRFASRGGALTANDPPFVSAAPGAGPRHFAFHPNGRFAYGINELDSTITAFRYDGAKGTLTPKGTISTLPADWSGPGNSTAEIFAHPSGRFVYGTNRGHDSIAMFAVNEEDGMLRQIGHESTQGRVPRSFGVDPSGRWLLAANQGSNDIVVFRIDLESGRLASTGTRIEVGSPVCVAFPPAR